jgi:hypothetical protein
MANDWRESPSGSGTDGFREQPISHMETIYVYLLDEGTDVWRPVDADHVSGNKYRILSVNPDPDDEHWQFNAGDVVATEMRELSGGLCLVAVSSDTA